MHQSLPIFLFSLISGSMMARPAHGVCEKENSLIVKGAPGCGPKLENIPIKGLASNADGQAISISGMYMKTHPSGDYVIVSGPTGIIDLSKRGECGEIKPKFIPSVMNSEVAPVEGREGWTLLASPNHPEGMLYFQFEDVLANARSASSDFQDSDHNQYYQSASEMEGSTEDRIKFRTVLYTGSLYKDYEVTRGGDGKFKVTKTSAQGSLCQKMVDPKEAALTVQERKDREQKRARYHQLRNRLIEIEKLASRPGTTAKERKLLTEEYGQVDRESSALRGYGDIGQIQNPVLSKDGKEISFVSGPDYSLRIARIINNIDCEIIHDLGYQAGKGSFSRPKGSKKGVYVFPANQTVTDSTTGQNRTVSGIYMLNKDNGKVTKIAEGGKYPGITEDGRVVYIGSEQGAQMLKIIDLNQIEGGDVSKCAKLKTGSAQQGRK